MQDVRFASIEEFLTYLPAGDRTIVDRLRAIVHATMPECEERLSYNVPYFRRHRDICFIWPGCVAWAGRQKPGVTLGFVQAHLMEKPDAFLAMGSRKKVGMHVFFHPEEIDPYVVEAYLVEAVRIDEILVQR